MMLPVYRAERTDGSVVVALTLRSAGLAEGKHYEA